MGSEVLSVDDEREKFMNVLLEMLDIVWEEADESAVKEAEVSEKVVANDDMALVSQSCPDLIEVFCYGF